MSDHINRAAQTLSPVPWADLSITEQGRWLNAAGRIAEAGLLATPEHDAEVGAAAIRQWLTTWPERYRDSLIYRDAEAYADQIEGLPIHRTEAGYRLCSTCDGGGCPDCTDPA